ncbi:MAG: hypothetical protein AAGH15_07610 [Myxococcota bacterium]
MRADTTNLKLALVAAIAVLASGSTAFAQGDATWDGGGSPQLRGAQGYPTAYVQRPLTIGARRIHVNGFLHVFRPFDGADPASGFNIGGSFGITDDLEVGVSAERMGTDRGRWILGSLFRGAFPLQFTQDFDYGDIPLFARFRLIDGDLELALEASVLIPTQTDFGFAFGVPIRVHLGDALSLDTGAELAVWFVDVSPGVDETQVNLEVPARFALQFTEELYLGLNTGFRTIDFDLHSIPFGIEVGFTIMAGSVPLDLVGAFQWPDFLFFGEGVDDNLRQDRFLVTFGVRAFIDV